MKKKEKKQSKEEEFKKDMQKLLSASAVGKKLTEKELKKRAEKKIKHMKEILLLIGMLWTSNPQLRFFQLLSNVLKQKGLLDQDMFFILDEDAIKILKSFID